MRHLFTTFLFVFALALGAEAQFIGYVSPQGEQQTLATAQTCAASPFTFGVQNLGQTQHWLSVTVSSTMQTFTGEIDGIDNQGNVYRISEILQHALGGAAFSNGTGTVYGSGYFPKIQVSINCFPSTATFTASYSGGWGTQPGGSGTYLASQIDKSIFAKLTAANASQSANFQTPYGSSAGTLLFKFDGFSAGTANVGFFCSGAAFGGAAVAGGSFAVATNNTVQAFQLPDAPCTQITFTYSPTGVTATDFSLEFIFSPPGRYQQAYQFGRVTGTTAQVIKGTPGFVHTLNINTANAAAGTVSIFDLASAACTGTPSTNKVAVITTPTAVNGLPPYIFDVNTFNGICVQASQTMDITVSFQ